MSVVNDESRRRLRGPARRALIEDAARAAFAERGYQAVSMGDIAAAAGVTRSVLYDHAPSKRALFEGLMRAEHAELTGLLAVALADDGTPARERFVRAIGDFVAYVDDHPIAGRVIADEPFGDDALEDARRALHAETKRALAGWIAGDAGERFDPRGARERVMVDVLYGAFAALAASRRRTPRTRAATVVDATAEVLWGGLAPIIGPAS